MDRYGQSQQIQKHQKPKQEGKFQGILPGQAWQGATEGGVWLWNILSPTGPVPEAQELKQKTACCSRPLLRSGTSAPEFHPPEKWLRLKNTDLGKRDSVTAIAAHVAKRSTENNGNVFRLQKSSTFDHNGTSIPTGKYGSREPFFLQP